MSSVQTVTGSESGGKGSRGFAGTIGAIGRRLSGTFIGSKPAAQVAASKDKRPPIYSYDEETGQMRVAGLLVSELAEKYKTPLYLYDVNRIADNLRNYIRALSASTQNDNYTLAYGVKANPSLGVLDVIHRLGQQAGLGDSNSELAFNCVSIGEIERVAAAGVDVSRRVIFSGIGKTEEEVEEAVTKSIFLFNVESLDELELIEKTARKHQKQVDISIRVNPDISLTASQVASPTAGVISPQHRFGVSLSELVDMSVRAKASAFLRIRGLSVHLQVTGTGVEPFCEARDKLLQLAEALRNESKIFVEHINLGGGFPVGLGPDLAVWIEKLTKPISEQGLRVILCPGRSLVADAGLLVSRVTLVKKVNVPIPGSGQLSPRRQSLTGPISPTSPTAAFSFDHSKIVSLTGRDTSKYQIKCEVKSFAVLDTSVFDFGSVRTVGPASSPGFRLLAGQVRPKLLTVEYKYDVSGATVEAGDVFARDYPFPEELSSRESLIVFTETGAYSFSLSGNFGSRIRAAQILVKDKEAYLIREREAHADLMRREKVASELSLASADQQLTEEPGN